MSFLPQSKLVLLVVFIVASFSLKSQHIGQHNVSATVNLLPVLQLEVTNNNAIEFVFDGITDYQGGVVLYNATTLKISSTVNWDLYAVGRSSGTNGPNHWDQLADYSDGTPNEISDLPLSLLELKQSQPNSGAGAAAGLYADYSQPFSPANIPSAGNSIYVDGGTLIPPAADGKYIAGHSGTSGIPGDDHMIGGSYLVQKGITSDFIYSIDYRILPGIPAIFPMAATPSGNAFLDLETVHGNGSYAAPGVYSMSVQYILLEDQ